MVKFLRSMTWVVLGAMLIAMPALAADLCTGTVPEAESWVADKLDEAKAARDRGDYDLSDRHLHTAATGFPRAADISIPSRCMGRQNWQRYYVEKQLTYRELGRRLENSDRTKSDFRGALSYYIEGDNVSDAERMLDELPDVPKWYINAGNAIRKNLATYQWALDYGFTLLADEQAGQKFYQARLDRLIAHSRSRGNALLRSEYDIISSDVSEEEAMIETAEETGTAFLGALAGDESIVPVNESRRDVARARRSLQQLREAQQWLQWIAAEEATPVTLRAVERGDAMLARADDTSLGLEGRDDYYAAAINYYSFADASDKVASAESSREAIEPALETERATRKAKIDEKANQMQESLKDFQQSMEKSDAEKESFKSEADSLEAELDF